MGEIERLVIPKFESADKENNCGALKETIATLKNIVAQVLHLCLWLSIVGLSISRFPVCISAYLLSLDQTRSS